MSSSSPAFTTPETSSATVRLLLAIGVFSLAVAFFGKPQATLPAPAHQAPAATVLDPN